MGDFDLIQQLQNPAIDDKTPLPRGHKYNSYTVAVDGVDKIVNIPLKESEKFESVLAENNGELTKHEFNKILREVRGIRG